jgi:hypothetical protein
MPMSSEPFMPEGLEDFPWKHLLHMWAYDSWLLTGHKCLILGMQALHGMLQWAWEYAKVSHPPASQKGFAMAARTSPASKPDTEDEFVPVRHKIPADAPPIRVTPIDPKEARAQAQTDQDVLDAWNEWKAAGRPALFNDSPRNLYVVPAARQERVVQMLKNASRLYAGVQIQFAEPIMVDKDGNAWIYWVAKERQKRADADAKRSPVRRRAAPGDHDGPLSPQYGPRFIPPSS